MQRSPGPLSRIALLAMPALIAHGAPGCGEPAQCPVPVERHLSSMGTHATIEVEASTRARALAASEAALRALEACEARLSTWGGESELARLNRAPAGSWFPLSAELRAELEHARHAWEATGGAFDPGIGALVELWDLRGRGRLPSPAELERALAGCGLSRLELGPQGARRTHPGLRLEEGGFGKGAGLDAALRALRSAGASRASIDLGGQVALLGEWRGLELELADPGVRSRAVLALRVDAGSLATSGNSERARRVAGELLGHLLDPRTGRPAADFGSLSVWAPQATTADCLATGLFVLGPQAALEFARHHPGIEVIALVVRDGRLRARASAGWSGRLRALVPDIEIEIAGDDGAPLGLEADPLTRREG